MEQGTINKPPLFLRRRSWALEHLGLGIIIRCEVLRPLQIKLYIRDVVGLTAVIFFLSKDGVPQRGAQLEFRSLRAAPHQSHQNKAWRIIQPVKVCSSLVFVRGYMPVGLRQRTRFSCATRWFCLLRRGLTVSHGVSRNGTICNTNVQSRRNEA